jgi:hypothetical protein
LEGDLGIEWIDFDKISQKMSQFIPFESKADPGDHFEVIT